MRELAIWAAGQVVERPRRIPRLERIAHRIHTPVVKLRAEVLRSAEPIPFTELDRAAFRPIRRGQAFGRTLECAWLRITGDAPADVPEGAVLLLGIRGEGLVHGADGAVHE